MCGGKVIGKLGERKPYGIGFNHRNIVPVPNRKRLFMGIFERSSGFVPGSGTLRQWRIDAYDVVHK